MFDRGKLRFDWRWVALFVVVVILANAQFLPWPILVFTLVSSGGYLLYTGWNIWQRNRGGSSGAVRVTYWRGQRIEYAPPKRSGLGISLRSITPALVFWVLGTALVLGALSVMFRELGATNPPQIPIERGGPTVRNPALEPNGFWI